ncbi:hypothetical protein ACFWVC_30210 [Streptomyces sp. NPDC058691]|uniref:hypothetical protein n=1 Tax=Streptomyces sp. NPDC058691 TaxID=3346601 RepID=UPI00365B805B
MAQLSRTLLRTAALAVSSVAALAVAGAAQAGAAQPDGQGSADKSAKSAKETASAVVGTINYLPVNPLARTTVNPLDNAVGSQVSDFKPVSTAMLTKPVADSRSVADLPLVGGLVRTLQGH